MSFERITWATEDWKEMTHKALVIKDIPLSDIENLLKETYMILTTYHKDTLIPKELTKLLLEIRDFNEISSAIEFAEKPSGYYHSLDVCVIVDALKTGFLEGEYECEFPKLKIYDLNKNGHIIDLRDKFLPLKILMH